MNSNDIIVGRKYIRADWPNCVWLGIGKRKPFTDGEFLEKFLVLIETDVPAYLGFIFKTVDDDYGCYADDWDLFEIVPINCSNKLKI